MPFSVWGGIDQWHEILRNQRLFVKVFIFTELAEILGRLPFSAFQNKTNKFD